MTAVFRMSRSSEERNGLFGSRQDGSADDGVSERCKGRNGGVVEKKRKGRKWHIAGWVES